MRGIDDLERVRKTDIEIIERLISDTKRGALNWYGDDDYIYTRVVTTPVNEIRVDTIFKISDQQVEQETDDLFTYEFQDMFSAVVTLDIYMSKYRKSDGKWVASSKEKFCRRLSISGTQLKLSELLETVLPVMKAKPEVKK